MGHLHSTQIGQVKMNQRRDEKEVSVKAEWLLLATAYAEGP